MTDSRTGRQISVATKLSFGIGQAAEGIKNNAFSLFLLFFYVQVHGLSPSLAGLALFIALCFDAITDPIAGYISDSYRSRWGRRHPFMYASAIPLAIAFYFTFVPPDDLGQWGLFSWLLIFGVITRAAMTLYHVPHIALGAELSDDYEERTSIVSYRVIFGVIGSLLVYLSVALFFPVAADGTPGQMNNDNYPFFALVCSLVMWLTIWLSAAGTQKEIPFLPKLSAVGQSFSFVDVLKETVFAIKNPNFRTLFLAVLSSYIAAGVNMAIALFMFTFFWELDSSDLQWVLIAGPVGVIIGSMVTRHVHRFIDKKTTLVLAYTGWAIFQFVPTTLRLVDLFPTNESILVVQLLVSFAFLQGLIASHGSVSFGSMIADIVDDQELHTGERHEGIFFAALSFASKATSGLGGLVAGFALAIIGWPVGDEIVSAADIPADTLFNLGVLYGPGVALFGFASVWLSSRYRLTREAHAEILGELERRRATLPE